MKGFHNPIKTLNSRSVYVEFCICAHVLSRMVVVVANSIFEVRVKINVQLTKLQNVSFLKDTFLLRDIFHTFLVLVSSPWIRIIGWC